MLTRRQFLALPAVAALADLARGASEDTPRFRGLLLSPVVATVRTPLWPHGETVRLTGPDRAELLAAVRALGLDADRQQRRWACFALTAEEAVIADGMGAARLATWAEWRRQTERLWNLGPIALPG